jgi:hypothetical protein
MKQFPTVQMNDDKDVNSRTVNQIQDHIVQALGPLLNLPLSTSNFLEDLDLTTGSNSINHGLGRILRGWLVANRNAVVDLYEEPSPFPKKTLVLNASTDAMISLIVF